MTWITHFCDSVEECNSMNPETSFCKVQGYLSLSLEHSTVDLINPKGSHVCKAELTVL